MFVVITISFPLPPVHRVSYDKDKDRLDCAIIPFLLLSVKIPLLLVNVTAIAADVEEFLKLLTLDSAETPILLLPG